MNSTDLFFLAGQGERSLPDSVLKDDFLLLELIYLQIESSLNIQRL